jgi:hypothetical protein
MKTVFSEGGVMMLRGEDEGEEERLLDLRFS